MLRVNNMDIRKVISRVIRKRIPRTCRKQILKFLNRSNNNERLTLIESKLEQLDLNHQKRIILFIVPNDNIANGGIMSIFSLFKVSKEYRDIHQSEVILATYPSIRFTPRFTKFKNEEIVVPFDLLMERLGNVDSLLIHVPEKFIESFLADLNSSEKRTIRNCKNSTVNILNQNIQAMPEVDKITELKNLFQKVTCTTAHRKYCTAEYRKKYGVPLHHFSAENLFSNYVQRDYAEKEELLIYSPDQHPLKEKIISTIRDHCPNLKLFEINNVTYTEYLDLCSRTKWSITFGEGLDGYFMEPAYCGACSFAVYNIDFFTEDYKNLETVYSNYETMLENIVQDMKAFDNKDRYLQINKSILDIIHKQYKIDEYRNNIKLYYSGEYTFR